MLKHTPDYSKQNFEMLLLFKRGIKESEIFRIFTEDDSRLGWMFPLQALQSSQHQYADDENFLKFARIAFEKLCDGVANVYLKEPEYEALRNYQLSEFYSDETVVLLMSRDAIKNIENFNKNDYLPFLAQYGYYLLTNRNPSDGVLEILALGEGKTRIKLISTSPALRSESFIFTLITEVIPYEHQPLSKFFFQYQLIELLLDKVLQELLLKLANEILAARGKSASELKDVLDQVAEKLSEKKRLNILFSEFLSTSPDDATLRALCNRFLQIISVIPAGSPELQRFSEYLYKVRNTLFHNFRNVDQNAQSLIEPISCEFKKLILEMLLRFQIPTSIVKV